MSAEDLDVKLAVYRHFAETARRPSPGEVAARAGIPAADVAAAYTRLRAQRVLVLEEDGVSIRMAPPFSGVPTQHVAVVAGKRYFANCAWDVFGIVAALQPRGTEVAALQPRGTEVAALQPRGTEVAALQQGGGAVESRCEQTLEPLRLIIRGGPDGPEPPSSDWRFHCAVPAAHWWDDIVLT
jgi:hypothetical protein